MRFTGAATLEGGGGGWLRWDGIDTALTIDRPKIGFILLIGSRIEEVLRQGFVCMSFALGEICVTLGAVFVVFSKSASYGFMQSPAEKDELLTVAGGIKWHWLLSFLPVPHLLCCLHLCLTETKNKTATAFHLFPSPFDSAAYGHSASWFHHYINETNPDNVLKKKKGMISVLQ